MLKSGANRVYPDRHDYSLLHTFGATMADVQSLPDEFSIYDGRAIPDQNSNDARFSPALDPLPYGCTGETGAFESGLQDGTLYDPRDLYLNTPPGVDGTGRDIRAMLGMLISRGPRKADGSFGPKRSAYFNCYGSGPIDDYSAAKIGLWLNQREKRGVYIGSFFYPEFILPAAGSGAGTVHVMSDGIVPTPSFNTSEASLHCYLATGWKKIAGIEYLECLTWQGEEVGFKGVEYFTPQIYNALMAQPWTGAFTITKLSGYTPVPIGVQADIDHFVYWFRHTFNV